MNSFLNEHLIRLQEFTKDCGDMMNETWAEQSIKAVFGPSFHQFTSSVKLPPLQVSFDNTFTGEPRNGDYTDMGFWLVNTETNRAEWFNLATIVALAREAK